MREEILLAGPLLDTVGQIRCHRVDVTADCLPGGITRGNQLGKVLVEDVADDADGEVRLTVQQSRSICTLALGLDVLPGSGQASHVGAQLVLAGTLGRGTHDDPGVLGDHLAQDLLQTGSLGVGELARDAHHVAVRHVDQVTTGQRDLGGQACALVTDGVLRDLNQDALAGAQRVLDPLRAVVQTSSIPVDLTGIKHGVSALADVDERGLHARQDVLDTTEIHVAGHRGVGLAGHVVLDQNAVLEDADLGAVLLVAHDHDSLDALAPGQELRLGDDGATAPCLTALATTQLLGFEPG